MVQDSLPHSSDAHLRCWSGSLSFPLMGSPAGIRDGRGVQRELQLPAFPPRPGSRPKFQKPPKKAPDPLYKISFLPSLARKGLLSATRSPTAHSFQTSLCPGRGTDMSNHRRQLKEYQEGRREGAELVLPRRPRAITFGFSFLPVKHYFFKHF